MGSRDSGHFHLLVLHAASDISAKKQEECTDGVLLFERGYHSCLMALIMMVGWFLSLLHELNHLFYVK